MMHRWTEHAGGRASWRDRRRQRRALRASRRAARWASWGPWGDGCGAGMDDEMEAPAAVTTRDEALTTMRQTIEALQSRVAILETLATGGEAKLAADIEQLRGDAR